MPRPAIQSALEAQLSARFARREMRHFITTDLAAVERRTINYLIQSQAAQTHADYMSQIERLGGFMIHGMVHHDYQDPIAGALAYRSRRWASGGLLVSSKRRRWVMSFSQVAAACFPLPWSGSHYEIASKYELARRPAPRPLKAQILLLRWTQPTELEEKERPQLNAEAPAASSRPEAQGAHARN